MKWELYVQCVVDDETYTFSHIYSDFGEARKAFFDTFDDCYVLGAVVYAYIDGYEPSIVLAYNNDCEEDFINKPTWID